MAKKFPLKQGDTGGTPGGSAATSQRNSPQAIQGGGSSPDPIPRKTRVVGQGQY